MDKRKFNENDKKAFRKYADAHAPSSALGKDCLIAFFVGGLICLIGQGVSDLSKKIGVNEENVKSALMVGYEHVGMSLFKILTSLDFYWQ